MNSVFRILQTLRKSNTGRIALWVGCCLSLACALAIHLGPSNAVVKPQTPESADDTPVRSKSSAEGASLLRLEPLNPKPAEHFLNQFTGGDPETLASLFAGIERVKFAPDQVGSGEIGDSSRARPPWEFSDYISPWDSEEAVPISWGKPDETEALRLWSDWSTAAQGQSPLFEPPLGRNFSYTLFQHHFPVTPVSWHVDSSERIPGWDAQGLDSGTPQNSVTARPTVTVLPAKIASPLDNPSMESLPIVEQSRESIASPDWSRDEFPDWWVVKVADVQREGAVVRSIGISDLIDQAIMQSPRIRMLQRTPAIVETQIQRERSVFDPVIRMETRYQDDQDPVGNQLQTGGPPVLRDNTWTGIAGVQRRFATGTTADVFQRLGFKNSNSLFFDPQDQGTSTIGLDVSHPMMRNSGREFNRSLIVLAELQGHVSYYEYQMELQNEMVEIGTLYWQLLNARMIVLQTQRSRDRAQQILEILQARADYDASANQISMAKSEVSQRTTELLEVTQNLREIEVALRDKISDSDFDTDYDVEFIPSEFPDDVFAKSTLKLNDALARGLAQRWELQREQGRTRMADRQLYMSRCRLAPRLDLVLGVYSRGLAGNSGVGQAFANQFGSATPGYYGGIEYEIPSGRRNARAEIQRDQLQKQQALDAFQVARNEVISQIKTAHIRLETSLQSQEAAWQTVLDMRDSLSHLQRRWEATALVDGSATQQGISASIALEQLLSGQRRLQTAENRLAIAETQVVLARQNMLVATGEVLETQATQSPAAEVPTAPDMP